MKASLLFIQYDVSKIRIVVIKNNNNLKEIKFFLNKVKFDINNFETHIIIIKIKYVLNRQEIM